MKQKFFYLLVLLSSVMASFSLAFAKNDKPIVLRAVAESLIVNHKKTMVFNIIQENGQQGITLTQGKRFDVILRNETTVPISIHWHGLILPNNQDGIPYVTQLPIHPGCSKRYQFPLLQSGTYWMHSHYQFNEQKLMAAPLIINDSNDPYSRYSRYKNIVVMLQDFSFKNPEKIFTDLKKSANQPMPANMMAKQDLNDVNYDAYLANRHTLENPQLIKVTPGDKIRLRIIDASSATNYWINTGELVGKLIAVDGQSIRPITKTLFQIAIAQRLDILLDVPKHEGQYPILAQIEGTKKQTGIILITPNAKLSHVSEDAKQTASALNDAQEKEIHAIQSLPVKPITKTLNYKLEGDMRNYIWKINNEIWPIVKPLKINKGDRVKMVFINNTGMSHPMHLHGHIFQLTDINGKSLSNGPLHDTILVQPHTRKTIIFDADNPGIWMLHCHVLYHMLAGMMTTTNYVNYPEPTFYKSLLKGKINELNNTYEN